MNKKTNILILVASLSLIVSYLFPIWQITLDAPQFPEGLYLHIYLNKISGANEYVLDNINILNHYIGMQKITPESIPELKIMPLVIAFFIVFGISLIFFKNKTLLLIWIISFVAVLILSLYDFYLWEYDYGHNLNPKAPIKVPGMVYQPPLIGEKYLLNFRSVSFPHIGSFFIVLSLILGMIAFIYEYSHNRNK